MRVGVILLVVLSCGPDGRAREPGAVSGVVVPDLSTGAEDPGDPRLDLPQWPDLPAESSSGVGSTSTGGEDSSSGSTGQGSTGATTGEASTGGDTSSGSTGSTGGSSGSSSTGPEPSGCPCAPGIDNFCDLAPNTCPPTAPGGYCDPDCDGAYMDGDFNAGFLDWKAECG